MSKITRFLIVCLFVGASASISYASNCHVHYPQQQVYKQNVVNHQNYNAYQNVVATTYYPVPLYTVGYISNQPEDSKLKEKISELTIEVKDLKIEQLKLLLQVKDKLLEGKLKEEVKNDGGDFLKILSKNCASCHDEKTFIQSGAGFKLLDKGSISHLNAEDKLNVLKNITLGKMPKGGKLSDAEFIEIVNNLK